jgi:hypothetical protein
MDNTIQITDEMIRGNYKMIVYTDVNTPVLQENKKMAYFEGINQLVQLEQMGQQSKYV